MHLLCLGLEHAVLLKLAAITHFGQNKSTVNDIRIALQQTFKTRMEFQ